MCKKSVYHLSNRMAGAQNSVPVNNWYTNDFHKIGTIETEGATLIYDQVGQMVQAMATLGAPGGSGGNWTDEQREGLAPIISAYWQPKF